MNYHRATAEKAQLERMYTIPGQTMTPGEVRVYLSDHHQSLPVEAGKIGEGCGTQYKKGIGRGHLHRLLHLHLYRHIPCTAHSPDQYLVS